MQALATGSSQPGGLQSSGGQDSGPHHPPNQGIAPACAEGGRQHAHHGSTLHHDQGQRDAVGHTQQHQGHRAGQGNGMPCGCACLTAQHERVS